MVSTEALDASPGGVQILVVVAHRVEPPRVQILMVVANIQTRALKTEVGKGSI